MARYDYSTAQFPFDTGVTVEDLDRVLAFPEALPIVMPGQTKPKDADFIQVRRADKGRKRDRAYLHFAGGDRLSLKVEVGPAGWESLAQDSARKAIQTQRDHRTTRIAPHHTKVCDLLADFVDASAARAAAGDIEGNSQTAYEATVERLGKWALEKTIDAIGPTTPRDYMNWARRRGVGHNCAVGDLRLLRRGINEALTIRKAPFRVWFVVPSAHPSEKTPFSPAEFDRTLLASLGFRFADADRLETVGDPETGERRPFRHAA